MTNPTGLDKLTANEPISRLREWPIDPVDILGASAVELTLTYDGPLPACQPNDQKSDAKHRMRQNFSLQLAAEWNHNPVLQHAHQFLAPAVLVNRHVEVGSDSGLYRFGYFYRVSTCGYQAIPLITKHNGLVCRLEIDLLRSEDPGSIVVASEGAIDIDNRLKVIFDALRMPLSSSEVPGSMWGQNDEELYCLLEDDSLISELSIQTRKWYGGGTSGDVRLVIKAIDKVLKPRVDFGGVPILP